MLDFETLDTLRPTGETDEDRFRQEVLRDYWICCVSREVSILGRREVLTGKAKFGILGDGKELPQVAMARAFKKGDWRAGYYRDQTFMFALGLCTVEEYFAQLYADADNDPFSGGRQMNAHFATPTIDEEGQWLRHTDRYNISSDISPTAGQMARALGLAFASKVYRNNPDLRDHNDFSDSGNEICVCTIGDASTSEGVFWETINAASVLKVPLAVSVWDDGYGISVPSNLQTNKRSISKSLEGFMLDESGEGIYLFTAKAWDYTQLCEVYERGLAMVREKHIPAVFHIQECTQPQGHSTSGSHERYKSKERLQWEEELDCIKIFGQWLVENELATEETLTEMREKAVAYVKECKNIAWKNYMDPVRNMQSSLESIFQSMSGNSGEEIGSEASAELKSMQNPLFYELTALARKTWQKLRAEGLSAPDELREFVNSNMRLGKERYNTHLLAEGSMSSINAPVVHPAYNDDSPELPGHQILNSFFDKVLERDTRFFAYGEDLGKIGGVNQGFAGLQEKYGEHRVFDVGIREWTIVGQAIGSAMRGLRPLAEIQYLDYLVYGLTALTDDLATVRYRSNGTQQAPVIIRTRGHRLEGIWHTGSPLGMMVNSLRGMHICVPRNMVQAAGMYNTLLQGQDPAILIECLNGYRLRERLPENIGDYTVPLGMPEILREGEDITLVTYGSCVRVAEEAAKALHAMDISLELIDVQTLLPFDLEGVVLSSLKKTSRVVFLDEDVPGGASAYMMREVLDRDGGYSFLDSKPVCLSAQAHRPPYGSDGDYFSKPSVEDIIDTVYTLMREVDPGSYPEAD